MHVLYSPKLTWIAVFAGLVWLAVLLSLTGADFATREWIPTTPAPTELAQPPDDESSSKPREGAAPTQQGVPHGE
jgi:hypothetical protein